MSKALHILMVAAENDGLKRCKVGGIGDVIRDIPGALASRGCQVSVVTPSYGFLHTVNPSEKEGSIKFSFAGRAETADLYRVQPRSAAAAHAAHYVVDHPSFLKFNHQRELHDIYSDDPPGRPFASDAVKFACFNAAVAAAVQDGLFGNPDVLHLHDWHAAFLLILRKYAKKYAGLRKFRTVYTIHNLSLQGVRPLTGDPSSLENWYPDLDFGTKIPADLCDPRWPDCINPMAVGIRLADAVHTVSPSYAQEILEPSRPPQTFGGEGLEKDLKKAEGESRLHGILNGCEYPGQSVQKKTFTDLIHLLRTEQSHWAAKRSALTFADFIVFQRLGKLASARKKPEFIAVSVSRVVEQKMLLLKAAGGDGLSGLESILKTLGDRGLYILLGTGDRAYEEFFAEVSARSSNFIFLNNYSVQTAETLYASGDLFLMPSSFEPCGISQMLAMRDGQPCLVNRTGGLRDTVQPGIDGFGFESDSLSGQVDAMTAELKAALHLHKNDPGKWQAVCKAAAKARFLWDDTARQYIEKLYTRS